MPDHPPVYPSEFKGNYHEYGLYLHNWYRRRHGAPPLKLAKWMNDSGDSYCYKLARNGGSLIHSSGLGYGENLWGGPQAEAWLRHTWPKNSKDYMHKCAVREACEAWYNEKKHYSYNNPGFTMHTGHFTAMLWKGSTELGIGVSWVGGTIIVAGCYKIHPNMQGQFRSNVLPYRSVSDTEDESDSEEEEVKVTPVETVEETVVIDNEAEKPENDKASADDKIGTGDPDVDATVEEEINPEMQEAFNEVADSDGKIGWYELKDLFSQILGDKVKWDKFLCRMLIKAATERDERVSDRVGFLAFENFIKGLQKRMEEFEKVDKDANGALDPFEVKDAFFSGGREISYQDVDSLMKTVGAENGKMSLYGFIIADVLLYSLSNSDTGIPEEDTQGQIEWMVKQVEHVKSNKPLAED